MSKKWITILLTASVLLLSAFAPNFAKKTFVLHNNTGETVTFSFINSDGDTDKETLKSGKWEITLPEGEYTISYKACGGTKFEEEFNLVNNGQWFTAPACPPETFPTKIAINSHFEQDITVTFYSQEEHLDDFSVTASFGRTIFQNVRAGRYIMNYDACGVTWAEDVKIYKNGTFERSIKSCETRPSLFPELSAETHKVRIINRYSTAVDVTLMGPKIDFVTLNPGTNVVYLPVGTYNYIYALYGTRYEGGFTVDKSEGSVTFIPSSMSIGE